jgi:hypothetical protein
MVMSKLVYPKNHISNVFRNVNWHNEAPFYGYGPTPGRPMTDEEVYREHNEANARARHRFAVENDRRRRAEEEGARKARAAGVGAVSRGATCGRPGILERAQQKAIT